MREDNRVFIPDRHKSKKEKFFENWGTIGLTALVCIGIVVGGKFTHTVRVVGSSMYPTLKNGNILITRVNDTSTKEDIDYDDIVVCSIEDRGTTLENSDKKFIKRVVGLPGDKLQIIDGRIVRNGNVVEDNFPIIEDAGVLKNELTLGTNEYFVIGDNRNDSYDCRAFGPITENEIKNIVNLKIM